MEGKKISLGGVRLSKTVILIVGLVLLFIPTYIMIFKSIGMDPDPLVTKEVSSAVLTLPNEETVPLTKEDERLELFLKMNETATKQGSEAVLDGLACYTVEYTVYGGKNIYKYYFSESPSGCYFTRVSGGDTEYYKIQATNEVSAFLERTDAEAVYAASALPTLTVSDTALQAQSVDWNYRTVGGSYNTASASFSEAYVVNEISDISLNFTGNFSRTPDSVQVTILDEAGNSLYDGPMSGMSGVQLERSTGVILTITATWEQQTGSSCYGSAVYKIKGTLHAPAEFYLNTSEIVEGGMVVLSGVNVLNLADAKIQVAPQDTVNYTSYTYQPTFYRDGDYVRALIPVSKDLANGTCGYTVTVTLGQNIYTMNFTATAAPTASPATRSVGNQMYVPAGTTVQDDPYADLYAQLSSNIAAATDFSAGDMKGAFSSGCKDYDGVRSVYGTIVTYSSIDQKIISHDNSWVGNKNTTLVAMHSGKVVYVGSTAYTGGLVIIDHGYGLLSWYWNLEKADSAIQVGVTVAAGDTIGTIMGSSFSEVYNGKYISAHTALTVFGTPVNSTLFSGGVDFADGAESRVVAAVSTLKDTGNDVGSDLTSDLPVIPEA